MFSAIIFDCDGVLINSESILRDYYRRFLAGLGLQYDPHAYSKKFKGKAWPQFATLAEAGAAARKYETELAGHRIRLDDDERFAASDKVAANA